jgi:hypothetical protein
MLKRQLRDPKNKQAKPRARNDTDFMLLLLSYIKQ